MLVVDPSAIRLAVSRHRRPTTWPGSGSNCRACVIYFTNNRYKCSVFTMSACSFEQNTRGMWTMFHSIIYTWNYPNLCISVSVSDAVMDIYIFLHPSFLERLRIENIDVANVPTTRHKAMEYAVNNAPYCCYDFNSALHNKLRASYHHGKGYRFITIMMHSVKKCFWCSLISWQFLWSIYRYTKPTQNLEYLESTVEALVFDHFD